MEESLVLSVQNICISNGLTLSLAESCTGGLFAASLTAIPDCSRYFLGSVVAYSNEVKKKVLSVRESTLALHGAVSASVAEEMARGVLSLTGSDYSLAVTGIAGPGGGTEQKPVGTIWVAIARKGEEAIVWQSYLSGSRQEINSKAVEMILSRFYTLLMEVANA